MKKALSLILAWSLIHGAFAQEDLSGYLQPPGAQQSEDWTRLFPDEISTAFRVQAEPRELAAGAEARLVIEFRIHEGWYLEGPISQGTALSLELLDERRFELLGPLEGKKGKIVHDEFFGELEKHFHSARFVQRLRVRGDAPGGEAVADLRIKGQTCREGSCRPFRKNIEVAFAITADPAAAAAEAERRAAAAQVAEPAAEPTAVAAPSSSGTLGFLIACFLGGLAMLLLPCIWPMIPITVSFFMKQSEGHKGSPALMALLYGFGIVATYTLIGFLTSFWLPPKVAQNLATSGVLNLLLGVLFIALALSFFGMFDLVLPAFITERVNRASASAGRGFLVGTLLLGVMFTVTSFACSAPVMANIWAFGLQSGNKWLVPLGMCAAAIAVSFPFVVLAMFPTLLKAMPKSGGWMNTFKVTLGFVELAAALKFLSNADLKWDLQILTWPIFMCAWITIAAGLTLYLFGLIRLPHDDPDAAISPARLVFGLLVGPVALLLSMGLFTGEPMPAAVTAFAPPKYYGRPQVNEQTWIEDFDLARAQAASRQRPIFVDFTGVNCTNCRLVEEAVFPRVTKTLESFVLARLFTDRGERQDEYDQLKISLGSYDLPYYVIFGSDGRTVLARHSYTTDANEFEVFLRDGLERFEQGRAQPIDRVAAGPAQAEEVQPRADGSPPAGGADSSPQAGAQQREVRWYTDLASARDAAKKQGKRIFLDFSGRRCIPCKRMEKKIFPQVEEQLRAFVLVKLLVGLDTEEERANREYLLGINDGNAAVPVYVIEDAGGKSLGRIAGEKELEEFAAFLKKGLED